ILISCFCITLDKPSTEGNVSNLSTWTNQAIAQDLATAGTAALLALPPSATKGADEPDVFSGHGEIAATMCLNLPFFVQ
ncbi:hypothetical protein HPB47_019381, partial [Ixodes persulcatus]